MYSKGGGCLHRVSDSSVSGCSPLATDARVLCSPHFGRTKDDNGKSISITHKCTELDKHVRFLFPYNAGKTDFPSVDVTNYTVLFIPKPTYTVSAPTYLYLFICLRMCSSDSFT